MSSQKQEPKPPTPGSSLRAKAVDQLARSKPAARSGTIEEIIYELDVHQIELEMQRDELRRSNLQLEEVLDKYRNLYDFAPIGYFTLNRAAVITEANLTGASLLRVPLLQLLNHGFPQFIAPEDMERWDRTMVAAFKHEEKQSCEVMIRLKDGGGFPARLECVRVNHAAGKTGAADELSEIHVMLTDITDSKQAEALRERAAQQEAATAYLAAKNTELEHFNKIMVNRELRMVELKKEMNALCIKFGQPPPYPTLVEPKE
ncbi:MAG: PAS domain-containing protein [Verrucomicrobia bacterium]|nr:PAS domain-containing protein [Verrucomicrobiota bacterium]